MKDNLVLSSIANLPYEEVATFLESLRATGSTAKVHFFVSGVSEQTVKKVRAMGATVEPFAYFSIRRRQPMTYLWPILKPIFARRDFAGKCRLGRWTLHLMALRFILYYDHLAARRDQYDNILLTDCRDVYFQRDPFSDHLPPGLHTFLESPAMTNGNNKNCRVMVVNAFGPKIAEELFPLPVSCAGTTMGDIESILLYLREMIEIVCRSVTMYASNDQGVHNYIVHRGLVPNLHIHDNYSSSVFTAGCESVKDIHFNERGEIIRRDGTVYPILHQIDRHVAIYQQLREKLAR